MLMEERADAILDRDLAGGATWVNGLGARPSDARGSETWRRPALIVAANRDRYRTTTDTPLGASPDTTAQKIDYVRAEAALLVLTKPRKTREHQAALGMQRARECGCEIARGPLRERQSTMLNSGWIALDVARSATYS